MTRHTVHVNISLVLCEPSFSLAFSFIWPCLIDFSLSLRILNFCASAHLTSQTFTCFSLPPLAYLSFSPHFRLFLCFSSLLFNFITNLLFLSCWCQHTANMCMHTCTFTGFLPPFVQPHAQQLPSTVRVIINPTAPVTEQRRRLRFQLLAVSVVLSLFIQSASDRSV